MAEPESLLTSDDINKDIYIAYVATISTNESRRQGFTAIFSSMTAAGVTLLGSDLEIDPVYVTIPLTFIGFLWWLSISYLKRLAQAKFEVVKAVENSLNFKPFAIEWEFFKKSRSKPHHFISLSSVEATLGFVVFLVFGLLSAAQPILWWLVERQV